jgi:ribosomal protein S18 acetylase RimI-like enzyme
LKDFNPVLAVDFVNLLVPGRFEEAGSWLCETSEYSYGGSVLIGADLLKPFMDSHNRALQELDAIEYLPGKVDSVDGHSVTVRVFDKIRLNGQTHIYSDRLSVTMKSNGARWSVVRIEHLPIQEEKDRLGRFLKTAGPKKPNYKIREINPDSESEISLVANRMRQTLVEVLGEQKGTELYSMTWLLDRVRWHLDPNQTTAKIFLSEDLNGAVIGHAFARIEADTQGSHYGYFSSIFVAPEFRNKGIANALILHVNSWLAEMKMSKVVYNTAVNHSKLIRLFERHGFKITHTEGEMIQLTKIQ